MGRISFLRTGHAGPADLLVRTPELRALRDKTVAVFGVGCLGAPCALELARAGVARLRLLDHDHVDPATAVRWPLGFAAAGLPKVFVLKEFIERNYPWTEVEPVPHRLGGVSFDAKPGGSSDWDVLTGMADRASLVLDATAEIGIQQFLSQYADERRIPYVGVSGANGGWGGKVFRFLPGVTAGCWVCYRYALADGTIPPPANRPDDFVQTQGCGDPTFTGANFDMTAVAMTAVRFAVSTLCAGVEGGYPRLPWDVMIVRLRDEEGRPVEPESRGYLLAKHPGCPLCSRE